MRLPHAIRFCFFSAWAIAASIPAGHVAWVDFVDETTARIVADAGLAIHDDRQKAYAWGDVDRDGDFDLVVVRKPEWETAGAEPNVLFVNESGVLTDRTGDFVSDATAPGDLGFLTPTNDRDVILVDVDLDGWLDIVTATTETPGGAKYLGHPRIYRNRGCSGSCTGTADWLGFVYEADRIPAMLTDDLQSGHNPCFRHVDAGDVDGDGWPDLWFLDADTPQASGCAAFDFNNKLLINHGASNPGYFFDATEGIFPDDFPEAFHAATGWIRDVNQDGLNDLIEQASGEIYISYNDENFPFYQTIKVFDDAAYSSSVGDLNHDDKLDLIVGSDNVDRYLLNDTFMPGDFAEFDEYLYSFAHEGEGNAASDEGFAGESYVADLDRDGWQDVVITDVDAVWNDCARRTHIYRNLKGLPGGSVTLEEQTTGTNCAKELGNPPECIVASIPADELEGVHDVAIFDIDGDGWKDLVLGRCDGTRVYLNQPPGPPAGSLDVDAGSLRLDRSGQFLTLTWGDSCLPGDMDFAIYKGELAEIGEHERIKCSTGGASEHTFAATVENSYFLVVPHNSLVEGSYGTTSDGALRPQAITPCLPRHVQDCS